MGRKQGKAVKEDENIELKQREEYAFSSPARERYINQCVPLHKAALKGDWAAAEPLLNKDRSLIIAPITEGGEIALHIASVEGHAPFVASLLRLMDASEIEITNRKGCTALTFAAAAGHVDIAKMMIKQNPSLHKIVSGHGITPLFMAALIGHANIANYLFNLSSHEIFEHWTLQDQTALLIAAIESGLYGLAMSMVNKNHDLAAVADDNGDTPLAILARSPCAFSGKNRGWDQLLSSQITFNNVMSLLKLKMMKRKSAAALPSFSGGCDAYALLDRLWECMIRLPPIDLEEGRMYDTNTSSLVFIAAEAGNYPFLVQVLRKDPVFLYKVNHKNHSIFHIAVLNRQVEIFNLIYEVAGMKDLMATFLDNDGNNMLHLAAMLAPAHQLNRIPGAALQMQREVLWYKEIEKIVQPSYRNMRNVAGLAPHDLFLGHHEKLMREGEKELKNTAKAFMLVTMLITTVVFAAAFTVPGGYSNETGNPVKLKNNLFVIFPISEAVATLSSLTSMLMFLSLLTSQYGEDDFLTSLPFWLVNGVMALFVSIVAMVAALCSSILLYEPGWGAAVALLVLFGSVPMMFIALKYQLLVSILRSTYGCRWLFGSNNCLFS